MEISISRTHNTWLPPAGLLKKGFRPAVGNHQNVIGYALAKKIPIQNLFNFVCMRHYSEIVTIDPQIRFGKPTIRGMRITVYDILAWFASGMTVSDIIKDYPELTEEDIKAALSYAADKEHKVRITL